ncbi:MULTISPECIES: CBS domain-containing protein [unclassified Streptococcus]|uniref:CBS domain-containing protein n=1 Tax=unclassified Streptococcus TaxID=2608887 RepID=UPI001071A21D|nr:MULTISPECIES: CBS domain-containing protein [unclassified Streptococcus]MBF0806009.1 CBS domain-containing protein [Streptococcus sp. 19428wA2_WM07]TFU28413.1 CBS domain-containing protein [Streptococcus sp. WM07]
MAVKEFMTKRVVFIDPDTSIAHAADLMREQNLHRLPVMDNGKLVGLVTEGTIAEATPSKATTLSIYEMNYLLNKTKVKDVMVRDVFTLDEDASLEDAVYLMFKHKVGILPVMKGEELRGVITDRDIFKAFLEVTGYGAPGTRIRVQTTNQVGVLERAVHAVVERNLNIDNVVNIPNSDGSVTIELQLEGQTDHDQLREELEKQGLQVDYIHETQAKAF